MSWFVYILRCANQSYYVGHTSNPEARFLRHRNSEGAQHTATYPPESILYQEQFDSEAEATRPTMVDCIAINMQTGACAWNPRRVQCGEIRG